MIELSLIVRVTVILGLCLTVLSATRRASASLRSLVLAVTFGMLLALPIATEVVPRVRVPLPTRVTATRPAVLMRSPATAPPRADAPLAGHARTVPTRPPSTVWQLLLVLWATGATLVVVPTLLAMIAAWRLRRRGTPWTRGTVMVTVFARAAGVRRRVIATIDDAVGAPATFGIIRPIVVFPGDAHAWSDDDLRCATIHEVEHVRRADWILHLAARLVCALYWFHPLVWIAWHRLRIETERACDDAVVRLEDAPHYAEQLVNLAARLSLRPPVPILSIAARSELGARVSSVLDPTRRRNRITARSRRLTLMAAVAVLLIVAAVQFTASQAQAQETSPRVGEILPPESGNVGSDVLVGGASLQGYLYDPFGNPVPGVVLSLESMQFGNPPIPANHTPFFRTTKTDAAGRFAFEYVPPGLYGVAAPTTDFVAAAQLLLHASERIQHDIHMRIEPITGRVTVCKECPGSIRLLRSTRVRSPRIRTR